MGFFLFCVCYAFVRVYLCFVVTCWERADLLALVCGVCEFVTFPLVSWVRCGTWLYWFLIVAPLLTMQNDIVLKKLNFDLLTTRVGEGGLRAWSGSKQFNTLIIFLEESFSFFLNQQKTKKYRMQSFVVCQKVKPLVFGGHNRILYCLTIIIC